MTTPKNSKAIQNMQLIETSDTAGDVQTPALTRRAASFAKNLHALMTERGMSRSDLARHIWGETTDPRGYKVARNRDRISQYLSGKSMPERDNLQRLASVFGVAISDLAPDHVGPVPHSPPEVQLTALPGRAGSVHLTVDKVVPMTVAARILALLTEKTDGDA